MKILTEMYRGYSGSRSLAGEDGWHRLVRYSPFDPQHRRQHSFVLVGDSGRTVEVRSYILDPYQLARNHLDGREVEDVHAVLSGERLEELL